MRRRLNLLALAVIAGGGTLLAAPAPLHATYLDPKLVLNSCCTAYNGWRIIARCCSPTGCIITSGGCTSL